MRVRKGFTVPNGAFFSGQYPGHSAVRLPEHLLRDGLARQLGGATEAALPYGRADVLTATRVFEVEPAPAWRCAVRQVLAYGAQTDCTPAVALFGAASREEIERLYVRLRDGKPAVELWWYLGCRWEQVTSRRSCRRALAPVLELTTEAPA